MSVLVSDLLKIVHVKYKKNMLNNSTVLTDVLLLMRNVRIDDRYAIVLLHKYQMYSMSRHDVTLTVSSAFDGGLKEQ